jgi:hypothetical protein
VRELNVWIVFLVFKGADIHSGFEPSEDPKAHEEWVNTTLNAAWNLAGPQNRVGYVNYPGNVPGNRLGSLNVCPPTYFGNYGSNIHEKTKEKNFASHGRLALGGIDAQANRLGREAVSNFYNSLLAAGLKLNINPSQLTEMISYNDVESSSRVSLKPLPLDPVKDETKIRRYLALYAWHANEADALNLNLTKRLLKAAKAENYPANQPSASTTVPSSINSNCTYNNLSSSLTDVDRLEVVNQMVWEAPPLLHSVVSGFASQFASSVATTSSMLPVLAVPADQDNSARNTHISLDAAATTITGTSSSGVNTRAGKRKTRDFDQDEPHAEKRKAQFHDEHHNASSSRVQPRSERSTNNEHDTESEAEVQNNEDQSEDDNMEVEYEVESIEGHRIGENVRRCFLCQHCLY